MMNSSKVKEIIKFSFYTNIQNKWFVIFNVMSLIGAILIMNWGLFSSAFKHSDSSETLDIAMLDNSNLVFEEFEEIFDSSGEYTLTKILENNYTAENIPDNLLIIEIMPDDVEVFKANVISKEGIKAAKFTPIKDSLYEIRNKLFTQKYNVSEENLNILQTELSINRVLLSVNADNSDVKEYIKLFSSALTYMIAVFMFSKLANEIIQEKQSKSIEYVLTTVSEKEYLFAKIFSNVAVLIIQGLFLICYYMIAVLISNLVTGAINDVSVDTSVLLNSVNKEVVYYILMLIVYNVLNLILLCLVQAVSASKTSSSSEAGNTVSLVTFGMLILYILTIYLITPYSKVNLLLYIASCLPVLSAYFVPAMMVIGQANVIQIVISLLLLIISIPLVFNYSAKSFKKGILNYTKLKKKSEVDKEREQENFIIKRKVKNFAFVVGTGIIIYIGVQTIFSLICSIALPSLLGDFFTETDITLIMQIILQVFSLGIASIFVCSYNSKNNDKDLKKIGMKQKTKIVLIAITVIFGLQFLLTWLVYPNIGLDYSSADLFDVSYDSSLISKIILVVALAITPAIFEELFFRKAIIDLSSKFGQKFALIFSALLFGIIHMNLSQGLFAFIIGLIFGMIYLYTNDIKLTMFIHFINNGFAALEMILPEDFALVIAGTLLLCLITGLVLFIKIISNKDNRKKIAKLLKVKVDSDVLCKIKYLFTDYTFDVAIILVALMSILTEKMLR